MDMTLLLQQHVWMDGHDFVIPTIWVDRWTWGQMNMTLIIAATSVDRWT